MLLSLKAHAESWALKNPVRIARQVYHAMDVVTVEVTDPAGWTGRGEAAGLPYEGETTGSMLQALSVLAPSLAVSTTRADLLVRMPRGGARNALDCALWDLECKRAGKRIWELCGDATAEPVSTAITFGIMSEAETRRAVSASRHMPIIKLKVDRNTHIASVRAAREVHPGARILVDANGSWDRAFLDEIVEPLHGLGVELIEQPVAAGTDAVLKGYAGPVPLAADESCTDRASLPQLRDLYQFVNIKLDKTGGLTEALALVAEARRDGFGLMVGNMGGTSLGMAQHLMVARHCEFVDLDAPLLCRDDREHALVYDGARVGLPQPELWG